MQKQKKQTSTLGFKQKIPLVLKILPEFSDIATIKVNCQQKGSFKNHISLINTHLIDGELVRKVSRREQSSEMYVRRELGWERKRQDRLKAWNCQRRPSGMGAFQQGVRDLTGRAVQRQSGDEEEKSQVEIGMKKAKQSCLLYSISQRQL